MLHWKYFQMWLILMFEVRIVTDAYEGSKQHLRKSVPVEWINLQFKITLEYDLFDRQRIWKTSPSMFNLLWIKNFELRNFLLSSTLKFDVFSTLNIDVVSTLKYDVSQSHMFQLWKLFWPMLGSRGHCERATPASSLAKGFAHGPLSLHPWQIELEFRIHALSISIECSYY